MGVRSTYVMRDRYIKIYKKLRKNDIHRNKTQKALPTTGGAFSITTIMIRKRHRLYLA